VNLSRARTAADSPRVIPNGYRARTSLATNVRGEFAQLGHLNVEEAGATLPPQRPL